MGSRGIDVLAIKKGPQQFRWRPSLRLSGLGSAAFFALLGAVFPITTSIVCLGRVLLRWILLVRTLAAL